jgi:hypothetical protein
MDNLKLRGKPDRDRVNVNEPWELRDWARHFGVTEDDVRRAVRVVGVMARDVARHLGKPL